MVADELQDSLVHLPPSLSLLIGEERYSHFAQPLTPTASGPLGARDSSEA